MSHEPVLIFMRVSVTSCSCVCAHVHVHEHVRTLMSMTRVLMRNVLTRMRVIMSTCS